MFPYPATSKLELKGIIQIQYSSSKCPDLEIDFECKILRGLNRLWGTKSGRHCLIPHHGDSPTILGMKMDADRCG